MLSVTFKPFMISVVMLNVVMLSVMATSLLHLVINIVIHCVKNDLYRWGREY